MNYRLWRPRGTIAGIQVHCDCSTVINVSSLNLAGPLTKGNCPQCSAPHDAEAALQEQIASLGKENPQADRNQSDQIEHRCPRCKKVVKVRLLTEMVKELVEETGEEVRISKEVVRPAHCPHCSQHFFIGAVRLDAHHQSIELRQAASRDVAELRKEAGLRLGLPWVLRWLA